MHLNSATTIRVPTKGGSPDGDGDPSSMGHGSRDNNSNSNNSTSRRIPRNWSLGSNFDLLDNADSDNYFLRNISNGSLDVAASLFSSFRETPGNSFGSTSAMSSLGIQVGSGRGGGVGSVGGAAMANYDFGNLVGNNGLGIGMRANMEGRGANLSSLYESELRAGRDAGVIGQGNRSVELAMKSSEAASALRRIEMEESLLRQPYQNVEEEHHQRMKAILHLQQQQNQILSNESRKTMLGNQGRYAPLQTHSPQPQRLQLSQKLLLQEQLRYQNERQQLNLSPARWKPSRDMRLTDFSIEELYQEVSRRRGDRSSVPNVRGDGTGEMGRGGRIDRYMPSAIERQNEGDEKNDMNTILHEGTSKMDRYRRLHHSSERDRNPAESLRQFPERDRIWGPRGSSGTAPTTKIFSKSVDEVANSSIVSNSTEGIGIQDGTNDGDEDAPRLKRLRDRNSSFDTLLSVFGDELAELDREENGRRNPKDATKVATSLPGSVGTITVEELIAGTSGDEASDDYESSSKKKSSSVSDISPIYNPQVFGANLPPRKSSRMIEDSPSVTTASMDAITIESIVRERALHQMRMDMREHLARTAEFGGGASSLPSSLSSTSSARAYLAELQGLLLPPPPLSHATTAMHYAQPPDGHQVQGVPPSATAKTPPPPQDRIDPKVALQQFLDKYGELAQNSRTDLLNAIAETEKSLVTIHDWDRSRGLRKCHSRTVVKTRRSRAKVKAFLLGVDPPKEIVKKPKRVKKETG